LTEGPKIKLSGPVFKTNF